jgi:hypothetical protein
MRSLVHSDFVQHGQSVTNQLYARVLRRFLDAVRWKRRDKWQKHLFMYHDNEPSPHRLFCSNSSPRNISLTSPNHGALRISLRVNFGCSSLWKLASRDMFTTVEDIRTNATDRHRKIPKGLPPVHPTMRRSL